MKDEVMNEYIIPRIKVETVIEELRDPELAKRIEELSARSMEHIHWGISCRIFGPPLPPLVMHLREPKPFKPIVTFDGC